MKQPKSVASWCEAVTTSLRPTGYVISSLTARESWKWTMVRCSCPMTCTRWKKGPSGSTTPRHRPTSRRLTFISSTASGRCNSSRSRSIMTAARMNKSFLDEYVNKHPAKYCRVFILWVFLLSQIN